MSRIEKFRYTLYVVEGTEANVYFCHTKRKRPCLFSLHNAGSIRPYFGHFLHVFLTRKMLIRN